MLFHPDFIARRGHIHVAGKQGNFHQSPLLVPRKILLPQVSPSVLGNIDQLGVATVDSVSLGHYVDPVAILTHDIDECSPVITTAIHLKFFSQAPTGKNQGSPRMLFFHVPHQVRRVADLSFDLFFAVTKIVVRDDRDNHPLHHDRSP